MRREKLHAYQQRLVEMRDRLLREFNMSVEMLRETAVKPGDMTALPTHPADADTEGLDEEVAIAHNEDRLVAEVNAALQRIEEGTFGTCQNCGREIEPERLDALPYTAWCIQCAQQKEGQPGQG